MIKKTLKKYLNKEAYRLLRSVYQSFKIIMSESRNYKLSEPDKYLVHRDCSVGVYQRQRILYASYPSIWEVHNIEQTLRQYYDADFFYVPRELWRDRLLVRDYVDKNFRNWISSQLEKGKVDLILTYFSGAEISKNTLLECRKFNVPIVTLHLDDRLHFKGEKLGAQYSGPYSVCDAYDTNYTNAPQSLSKYNRRHANAVFMPEAANTDHFKPIATEKKYDVSFIGAKYGRRERFIEKLRELGLSVECFGPGWANGTLTEDQMVEVYNKSWINLGFGFIGDTKLTCLKGRDFEVPSCGVVYMTNYSRELELVYDVNKEILTYTSAADCANKINKLLKNKSDLEAIGKRARQAVLSRHTWHHRFQQMLQENS